MSVALVIPENWDIPLLLSWAVQFTRAEKSDLLLLMVRRRPDKSLTVEDIGPDFDTEKEANLVQVAESLPADFAWVGENSAVDDSVEVVPTDEKPPNDDDSLDGEKTVGVKHRVRVVRFIGANPAQTLLDQLSDTTLLIIPRHASVRIGGDEYELERTLFRDAPCRAMQLRPGTKSCPKMDKILVAAGSPDHTNLSFEYATSLADANDGQVTALFVVAEVDEVAEQVGHRKLDRIVSRAIGRNSERVRKKVTLCAKVAEGIRAEAAEGYDLILSSANYHGRVHRLLFHGVSEQLLTTIDDTPVAVVRRAMPFTTRIGSWLADSSRSIVPQLDREHRIQLVDRIQANSRWDFDFIALTCLSTLIAAMGLLQNSSAVVIGAMLVAPLMTPLLGAGLSLVQGNKILLKSALGSVLRGFLLAFAIGWMLGIAMRYLSPLIEASPEMLARGQPGVLDLFVALISGIAAAYAIGRPNLLSALPGVAIAAALVPPIATSGLALAFADPRLAQGAALLFFTNIVAIILGTALSLWLVGIRAAHEHGSFHKWTNWIAGVLIVTAVGLAIYESAERIQTGVVRAVRKHLVENSEYRLIDAYMNINSTPPSLHIRVEGKAPVDEALAKDVLQVAKLNGLSEVRLEMETQITTIVSDLSTENSEGKGPRERSDGAK